MNFIGLAVHAATPYFRGCASIESGYQSKHCKHDSPVIQAAQETGPTNTRIARFDVEEKDQAVGALHSNPLYEGVDLEGCPHSRSESHLGFAKRRCDCNERVHPKLHTFFQYLAQRCRNRDTPVVRHSGSSLWVLAWILLWQGSNNR